MGTKFPRGRMCIKQSVVMVIIKFIAALYFYIDTAYWLNYNPGNLRELLPLKPCTVKLSNSDVFEVIM